MEKAFATGDNRTLFQLIRSTGSRKPGVSETITEKDGSVIHSQQRRLERWAEHFGEQSNQPPATESVQKPSEPEWILNSDYPTETEVQREIANLKRNKAAGPDGIPPLLFEEGENC